MVSLIRRSPLVHEKVKAAYYLAAKAIPFISARYLYLGQGRYLDIRRQKIVTLTPNLVVVGAQRAGTTSLHHYLSRHPDIFMSTPYKEPCLYLEDRPGEDLWREHARTRGRTYRTRHMLLKAYMLQGYRGQQYIGESSTYYTMGRYSRSFDIPEKMRASDPRMKLIYLVRHPLQRIVSHYLCGDRINTYGSLDQFVARDPHALLNSLYHWQLEAYLSVFPPSQLMVVVFEEFVRDPGAILDALHDFLGLRRVRHDSPFRVHNPAPDRHRVRASDLKFSEQIHAGLMEEIRRDVARLEIHLGRSLSLWDLSRENWCG